MSTTTTSRLCGTSAPDLRCEQMAARSYITNGKETSRKVDETSRGDVGGAEGVKGESLEGVTIVARSLVAVECARAAGNVRMCPCESSCHRRGPAALRPPGFPSSQSGPPCLPSSMEGGRAALLVTPPPLTKHRSKEGSGGGGESLACKKRKKEKAFYPPQRGDSWGEGWPSRQRNTMCVSAACFQNKAVALGSADVTLSVTCYRRDEVAT